MCLYLRELADIRFVSSLSAGLLTKAGYLLVDKRASGSSNISPFFWFSFWLVDSLNA